MGIDTTERNKIFNLLFGSYKTGTTIAPETMSAYKLMLTDIPVPALKAGVMKCITNCKFLPSIAEIREASQDFYEEVTDTRKKSYSEAWNEVLKTLASVGYYGKPQWSTPEIAQAVESLGYINLCTMEQEQVPTYAAQFRGIYNQTCERSKAQTQNQALYQGLSAESRRELNPAKNFIDKLAESKGLKLVNGSGK